MKSNQFKFTWKLLPLLCLLPAIGLTAEFGVRRWLPQEANGWGEREALVPDDRFGWKMKPSGDFHLRWEHYDYRLQTNSLGFVGPEYPVQKSPKTLRIMLTGDAFTSAEGVDTQQSWARLLEQKLAAKFPDRKVEVLNFAITGYGPNQYLATIQEFAPRYQPDLIITEFFVNDFQDAVTSHWEMQQSIGFQQRSPNTVAAVMRLAHFRQWFRDKVVTPTFDQVKGQPTPAYGYFLGHFKAKSSQWEKLPEAQQVVGDRVRQIKQVADQVGAKVIMPMVPSSIQVCKPQDLAYYPRNVQLQNYDLNLPQRLMQDIAAQQQIPFYDLRPTLQQQAQCPYHPRNMHWLPQGHEVVADYMVEKIMESNILR
jgi:hypothetical protein